VNNPDVDSFRYVQVSQEDRVGIIRMNRAKELNAINQQLANELVSATEFLDNDPTVHTLVLTGTKRVFAAGADVSELVTLSTRDARERDIGNWIDKISMCKKPIIAAISGFSLGAGCELAMVADIIIADKDAKFGLPEITLGVHPGYGGTQRLVRTVGKTKAMEMILTGRQMLAEEAESSGLVSRLTEPGQSIDEALEVARIISRHSLPVITAAKECINAASDMGLKNGLLFERRSYESMYDLNDQKEGMRAFIEERKPSFGNK